MNLVEKHIFDIKREYNIHSFSKIDNISESEKKGLRKKIIIYLKLNVMHFEKMHFEKIFS